MTAEADRKTFQAVQVANCFEVSAGGGLIDVHQKPYRQPREWKLTLAPAAARQLATALIQAADASEPRAA